ncbi:hypothetical protein [Algoriphagus pacificus]|uniref:Outer membrane protein beta-barrel domain-containing protein n=1 Tax=Algoriphagus pacificus TaxID=2811234 RepID=A0ABS3CE33_9BACT|nr:hypothetical protein [Algoriphagus pacificus]MBN7815362.1 hypothetical protein [Algoriphagus pacificus]
MKNQLILLILFVFSLSTAFAQNEPDTVIYTKDKIIKVFGNTWKYTKNEEGKWILEVEEDDEIQVKERYKTRKFRADLNTELGINLVNPTTEMPAVKPWGSWYYAINMEGTYKPARNFHLISSLGVSWYNFKLEDTNLIAVKNPDGIVWEEFEPGTGTKSKISASYVNLTVVPTILTNNQKLRLGLGGYAGLRVGGRGKFVYDDENGDKTKVFEKSNMYIENFRYGARGEVGIGDVTLFFNYDLNDLFQENLGPKVNAMSFGVTIR